MRRAAAAAWLLGVAGCTVGPNFSRPKPPVIPAWRSPANDAAINPHTDPDPRWWDGFGDPVLSELIRTAIGGNLDLQQAVLRVVEARQSVATAAAAGLPTLNGTATYMREQLGIKGILQSRGVYGQLNSLADQGSPLNQAFPGAGTQAGTVLGDALNQATQPINLFQYGLDASWELDLFGRVRRSVEQARASEQAQAEQTNDALIMLESQVAQSYVQLRGAQAMTASQLENIGTAQTALTLAQRRQAQGLGTALDTDQALTQLKTYQSQLPGFEKQQQQAMDQLDLLVGQPPGVLDDRLSRPAPLPSLPHVIDVGVPSTLARRRPDIRAAEAQLHAATANVGVAVASFYPDVSLTGNLGIRATDASYLTRWASHFYSAGPSISLPIFQGGRLTAGLRLARAQQAGAALQYRSTVLNALREVEDALVAYRTDRDERAKLADTVRTAADTLYLAGSRYSAGLSDFIQVLDAERTLISTRQQVVQQDMVLADDVVALYRALGGGWQDSGASPPAPHVPAAPPPVPAALDSVAAQ